MIDITKELIYIDGKNKTRDIDQCNWNSARGLYKVVFVNSSTEYQYNTSRLQRYKVTKAFAPEKHIIVYKGRRQNDIEQLFLYENGSYYLKPAGKNGWICDAQDLCIDELSLANEDAKAVFSYLKELTKLSDLRNENGQLLLPKKYETVESSLKTSSVLDC